MINSLEFQLEFSKGARLYEAEDLTAAALKQIECYVPPYAGGSCLPRKDTLQTLQL